MASTIKHIIKFIHVETSSWFLKEESVFNKAIFYGKDEVLFPMKNERFLESLDASPVLKRGEVCFVSVVEKEELLLLNIYTDKEGVEGMEKPVRQLEIRTINELLQQLYPVSTEGYTVNDKGQIIKL